MLISATDRMERSVDEFAQIGKQPADGAYCWLPARRDAGPPEDTPTWWAGARVAHWSHPALSDSLFPIQNPSRRCRAGVTGTVRALLPVASLRSTTGYLLETLAG